MGLNASVLFVVSEHFTQLESAHVQFSVLLLNIYVIVVKAVLHLCLCVCVDTRCCFTFLACESLLCLINNDKKQNINPI